MTNHLIPCYACMRRVTIHFMLTFVYVVQVALICILGQIGSYVPAVAAKLGILDGVYTRYSSTSAFDPP